MPAYEFRCRQCGTEYEIRATISEYSKGLKTVCPSCGSEDGEQLISLAAIFRGGAGGSGGFGGGCWGPSCCGGN